MTGIRVLICSFEIPEDMIYDEFGKKDDIIIKLK